MTKKIWKIFEDKILPIISALGFLSIILYQLSVKMSFTGVFYSSVIGLLAIAVINVLTCVPYINKNRIVIVAIVTIYTVLMIYELVVAVHTTIGIWNRVVTGIICLVVGFAHISFEIMVISGFYYPKIYKYINMDEGVTFAGFTYFIVVCFAFLRMFTILGYLWFVQPINLMYITYMCVTEVAKALFLVSIIVRCNRVMGAEANREGCNK